VPGDTMPLTVTFCGEDYVVEESSPLTLGRDGDVVLDDNPYLHRRFLCVSHSDGLWWLSNVGSQLSATVADDKGLFQTWLAPGVVHGGPNDVRVRNLHA